MVKKIIFLDVDGTLVNSRQELPLSTRRALKEARDCGHTLVIATGRARTQIYPWILDAGFDGFIGDNGGYAEFQGVKIFDTRIGSADIEEITDWVESLEGQWCWQSSQALHSSEKFLEWFSSADLNGESGNWQAFVDLVGPQMIYERPEVSAKLTFIIPREKCVTITECQERWKERFEVVEGSVSDGINLSGELSLVGVNKGTGMRALVAHLGFELSDAIAIGDSANDVEMLSLAGFGIAMGNATPPAREAADWVTSSIDNDGVARAFEYCNLVLPGTVAPDDSTER